MPTFNLVDNREFQRLSQVTHALEDRAVLYAPGVFGQLLGREMFLGQPLVEPLGRFDNPALPREAKVSSKQASESLVLLYHVRS